MSAARDPFGMPALPRVTVGQILRAVSAEFGVPPVELLGAQRARRSALPRHAVMGLAREMTLHSLPQIGRAMRRDHTTVLKGISRHQARLAQDPDYAARIRAVSDQLQRSMSDA